MKSDVVKLVAVAFLSSLITAGFLIMHPQTQQTKVVYVNKPLDEALIKNVIKNSIDSVVVIAKPLNMSLMNISGHEKLEDVGAGFYIAENLIVTNYHVIKGADEVKVKYRDGKEEIAEIVGKDSVTDIAVLKVKRKGKPLKLGDSSKVEQGDFVVVIGNPYRFEYSVSFGIVSALGRSIRSGEGYLIKDVIQVDAAINPGNSGGPVLNLKGEVIGMSTAFYSASNGFSGIGFAISSNVLKKIVEEIVKYGKVRRPWIGVFLYDWNPVLAKKYNISIDYGALILEVSKGSPADKAGLRGSNLTNGTVGDIIVEMDGVKVKNVDQLLDELFKKKAGERIRLKIFRNGRFINISLVLAERPSDI